MNKSLKFNTHPFGLLKFPYKKGQKVPGQKELHTDKKYLDKKYLDKKYQA